MIELYADDEGVAALDRRLMIVADDLDDWTDPFSQISDELLNTWQLNFSQRGGLFGGWQAPKKDYGHPLLEDTKEMRDSFASQSSRDFVKLWNTDPKFKYHQSREPRSKLPRRVMMMLDKERKDYITKTFQQYIIEVIRNSNNG